MHWDSFLLNSGRSLSHRVWRGDFEEGIAISPVHQLFYFISPGIFFDLALNKHR